MEPRKKVLNINYEKCTGCRLCEMICSVKHAGVSNPARSCIKVVKWESEGLYVPVSCQQCEDAPCMAACPVKAHYRDEALGRVMIDYDVCIGCRTCVTACPFGATNFDPVAKKVIKCDLCDGDPQCVSFCEVKCVDFVDAERVATSKKRDAAHRLTVSQKKTAALLNVP